MIKKDIGDALLLASGKETGSNAVVLVQAVQIVCQEIFQMKYQFSCSLDNVLRNQHLHCSDDSEWDQYPISISSQKKCSREVLNCV